MMAIVLGSDWVEESEEFLIDGLLCDSLTLISGQPKSGKSALALHIAQALLGEEVILDRNVKRNVETIGWMGFDLKWKRELKDRSPELVKKTYFIDAIHHSQIQEWEALARDIKELNIGLLVIDHLYGLAGRAELDKQYEVQAVLQPIMNLINTCNIPVVLLTQAGKANDGRAAHSVAIEGVARWLIRITGSGKSPRTLSMVGNNGASERLKIYLDPSRLEFVREIKAENKPRQREVNLPEKARQILNRAPQELFSNASALGKWYSEQGLGIRTPGSGRTFINNLIKAELFTKDSVTGLITRGPKLS